MAMWEPAPANPHPTTSAEPTPSLGIKQWHHSLDQEVTSPWSGDEEATGTSEEPPCHKQRNRMPLAKLLKGRQWEAFTKDSNLVQRARGPTLGWTALILTVRFHMICLIHFRKWHSAGLRGLDIYEVQDTWMGQKDLCTANHAAKTSQRNIQFFCMVTATKLPSIMGLEWIHSLEDLCRWGGHSYCPWCAKEGQNEGTMVNHLHTVHYHLGQVCTLCLAFFTTSADTMRKHEPHCKAMATGDREEK